MANRPLTLAFVGDVMPGRGISDLIPARNHEDFWRDALPVLRSADAVAANLECPITTHAGPWDRTRKAFRFRAVPGAADLLNAANVRFVSLANNHILDYQERGLFDTIRHLDAAGIAHAGAGRDSYNAARPAVLRLAGATVSFIALTDHMREFAATHDRPGTNYLRITPDNATLTLVHRLVGDLRQEGADVIIASCHWGHNLRPWQPRRFRKFARLMVEMGVDIVHGHAGHVFRGVETHRGGLILYDTGCFLDDYRVLPGFRWNWSFVFLAELAGR